MHPLDELKAYVGFGPDDEQRLRALRPYVTPEAKAIADRFYDVVLRFPNAAAVFADMAQVERLKGSLVRWMDVLLTGPWDEAYYDLRRRIGRVHVKVGLASQYMFTSMNRLMQDIHDIASRAFPEDRDAYAAALRKATDIELAIMLSTYIEVREQQGLEDFRDVIISHLPMTVLLVDRDGRVVATTNAMNELFAAEPLTGLPLSQALRPELLQAADLSSRIARAVETEREIVLPRVEIELPTGRRTLRASIVPLKHALANALVHIEDLSETLSFEARAKQAEHLAKLGTLAASVAHEIRNPLAGISGTVQVIASSLPEGDPRRSALGKVQEQIARLGTLVGDLLSFSRPITAQSRAVRLEQVVAQVVQQTEASEGASALVEGAGRAYADPALLAQVLANLVQNAWQAGAKQVVVQLEDGALVVVDDGPGIPADQRAKIFEPFFTTKVRGTGLGLPVAAKMVDAMRGELRLCPSPIGGAGFRIELPVEG
jgi:signal transduction histidine kinase